MNFLGFEEDLLLGITVKSEYALRLIMEIARCGNASRPSPLSKLVKMTRMIPKEFAEKIMSELRQAGIVKSIRGRYGGYTLNGDPKDITVLDIVRAVDEPEKIKKCAFDIRKCENSEDCVLREAVWERLFEAIEDTLKSVTIQNLIDLCQSKDSTKSEGSEVEESRSKHRR